VASWSLTPTEIKHAAGSLLAFDAHTTIAGAVAAPLELWGISIDERVAMAEYLARRHVELTVVIAALPA
jgi:hypothetical protein